MRLKRILLIFISVIFIFLFPSCTSTSKNATFVQPKLYNLQADVVNTANQITYKKLSITDTINGLKTSCVDIIDKSNILLLLYPESQHVSELGIYNLESGKYTKELSFSENQLFEICALDKNYLILRMSTDDWRTCGIYSYSFAKKELHQIYQYSTNPDTQSSVCDNCNNILLLENYIWFDDYSLGGSSEILVDLYRYDLSKSDLNKIRSEAQNPLFYDGKVYFFTKNESNQYRLLQSIDDSPAIPIDEQLMAIAASKTGVFCIENKFTDEETQITEFQIKDIIMNVPIMSIMSTTYSIDQLNASEYFVTWRNFDEEVPCVYDIKAKKIIVFSELAEGINSFSLKEDYGILIHTRNGGNDIYLFEKLQ